MKKGILFTILVMVLVVMSGVVSAADKPIKGMSDDPDFDLSVETQKEEKTPSGKVPIAKVESNGNLVLTSRKGVPFTYVKKYDFSKTVYSYKNSNYVIMTNKDEKLALVLLNAEGNPKKASDGNGFVTSAFFKGGASPKEFKKLVEDKKLVVTELKKPTEKQVAAKTKTDKEAIEAANIVNVQAGKINGDYYLIEIKNAKGETTGYDFVRKKPTFDGKKVTNEQLEKDPDKYGIKLEKIDPKTGAALAKAFKGATSAQVQRAVSAFNFDEFEDEGYTIGTDVKGNLVANLGISNPKPGEITSVTIGKNGEYSEVEERAEGFLVREKDPAGKTTRIHRHVPHDDLLERVNTATKKVNTANTNFQNLQTEIGEDAPLYQLSIDLEGKDKFTPDDLSTIDAAFQEAGYESSYLDNYNALSTEGTDREFYLENTKNEALPFFLENRVDQEKLNDFKEAKQNIANAQKNVKTTKEDVKTSKDNNKAGKTKTEDINADGTPTEGATDLANEEAKKNKDPLLKRIREHGAVKRVSFLLGTMSSFAQTGMTLYRSFGGENVDWLGFEKEVHKASAGGPHIFDIFKDEDYEIRQICQYNLNNRPGGSIAEGEIYGVDPVLFADINGQQIVAAYINGEKSGPIPDENGTIQRVYKIGMKVSAINEEVHFNIKLLGDRDVDLYKDNVELLKGDMFERKGTSMIVKMSETNYHTVCIVVTRGAGNFLVGLENNRLCADITSEYTGMEDFDFEAANKFTYGGFFGEVTTEVGDLPLNPNSIDYACIADDDCGGGDYCSDGFCKAKDSSTGTGGSAGTGSSRDRATETQQQEENEF